MGCGWIICAGVHYWTTHQPVTHALPDFDIVPWKGDCYIAVYVRAIFFQFTVTHSPGLCRAVLQSCAWHVQGCAGLCRVVQGCRLLSLCASIKVVFHQYTYGRSIQMDFQSRMREKIWMLEIQDQIKNSFVQEGDEQIHGFPRKLIEVKSSDSRAIDTWSLRVPCSILCTSCESAITNGSSATAVTTSGSSNANKVTTSGSTNTTI